MNKVIEYIISAKDATAAAINSAINRVTSFAKTVKDSASTSALDASMSRMNGLARAARVGASTMAMMTGALSSLGGVAGKVSRAISSVAMGLMSFGPIGAVIAGVQAAFAIFVQSAIDKAEALKKRMADMAQQVNDKLAKTVARVFADFSRDIDRVAESTEYLTKKFEDAAKAAEKMYNARKSVFDAQGEAEIAQLERQAAENGGGPEWALEIARKREEIARRQADMEAEHEREMLKTAQERLVLAEKNARALQRAYEAADKEYLRIKDSGLDEDRVNTFRDKRDTVMTQLKAEEERVRTARLDFEAMQISAAANEIRRNNSVTNAGTGLIRAYDEVAQQEAEIEQARQAAIQEEAQQEERARLEIERKISAERVRQMREEVVERSALELDAQQRLQAAIAAESQAWGWYRNRDAWKAQLAEEKANAEAEKQFEKDFDHLKRFRSSWRTNTNLSEDEEIVRRVGLAREQREAAEDYARQTAQDTARAAAALESIEQAINEGSAE